MRKYITAAFLSLAFLTTSCATSPKVKALQIAAASDTVADGLAASWEAYTQVQIMSCRSQLSGTPQDTPEGRTECLGLAAEGEKFALALQALVAAQEAVKLAAKCSESSMDVPMEFLEECGGENLDDWTALAATVESAWAGLRPYVAAMKGMK
jgi:hypothetical protein